MSALAIDTPRDAIDRYHLAISREAELSSFWGRYFALGDVLLDVPNGFAHHARLLRYARAVRILLVVVRPAWVFVGLPMLSVLWALRWSLASGWGREATVPGRVYLCASNDRNMSFVPSDSGRPSAAILLPWRRGPVPGRWATSRIDLRAISTRWSVWRAAWLSMRAGIRLWRSPDRHTALFTYTAPAWFWVYDALRNAALESVWISNHVDRWASLVTSLPGVPVTMVQHGDLGHHDVGSGVRLVPRLARTLPNVERVFVTDAGAVDDFITAVTGVGPTFSRIELAMRVVPWVDASHVGYRVLIIGHPDAHAAIGRLIRDIHANAGGAVHFAYRPHPTEMPPVVLPYVSGEWVTVTATDDTVPEVDVVVSYGSSVTGEIVAATGADLVHWDPNDANSAQLTVQVLTARIVRGRPSPAAMRG